MKILSAAEMNACDRATSERFGLSPAQLMQSASSAVAAFARQQFPAARCITVLCGRGNNGGDGMIAARLLAESGCAVTVLLLGDPAGLHDEPATAWKWLTEHLDLLAAEAILSEDDFARHSEALTADLVLDAICGTGFKPPLRGLPLAALNWLQAAKSPVLAVDLPSGWDADEVKLQPTDADNKPLLSFPADAIITFTAPKPAHVFSQLTRYWYQPVVVASIGSSEETIVSSLNIRWTGSAKAITEAVRTVDSNKGMYGHVLVVGGSPGKSGAPGMTALAALRTGAGLVTAAVSPSVLSLVAALAPELMTHALIADETGQISAKNLEAENLKTLLNKITVLAIGPGLGETPEAVEFALGLLAATRIPAVVDADALNAIARQPEKLIELAKDRTMVLTPHPGEMARLTGLTTKQVQADRLKVARDFSAKYGVILVLKGARTLIAHPDGSVAVNTTGNPGMAKGGSGDLLTGFVASLLGQHPKNPKRAVEAAVYLHGLAADITVRQHDQHTLLATDSLAYLDKAFRFRPFSYDFRLGSGYGWLQGLPADFGGLDTPGVR
ncbi:NAD(P)H-hydrate dehydratase [Acidicapsa ligni]|uniref:NAD(P)H-hydrate dehydratase n=1 Tax=Acidicapsa ligni TaxID=542300 RepID=UPI0021E0D70A|nr:NAD(P)H-hydrate dehydratase [Acidicapsa ligni]